MDFSCLPILVPKPQQCPLLPSPFIFCQKAARTLLTTSFSLTLETHYPLFLLTVLSDQDFSPFPPQLFLSATVIALLFPAFAPSEQRMAFYHLNAEPFQSFEHWLHPNTSFVFLKKRMKKNSAGVYRELYATKIDREEKLPQSHNLPPGDDGST